MRWWKRNEVEPTAMATTADLTKADLKKAYERGRRDERARRKNHPVLALTVSIVALAGAGMIFLAAREGSFSRGGEVVDLKLANATDSAVAAAEQSRDTAQLAVNRTGDSLRQR